MNLDLLSAPIPENEKKTIDKGFGQIPYIDARFVQTRLDQACGPQNWTSTFRYEGNGWICSIAINIGEQWVAKEDGGLQDPKGTITENDYKGSLSDAFKRAAVMWGIGRDLYEKKPSSKPITNSTKISDKQFSLLEMKINGMKAGNPTAFKEFQTWYKTHYGTTKLKELSKKDASTILERIMGDK